MTRAHRQSKPAASSAELAAAVTATNFSDRAATVVGYGNMGKQYVAALRALGIRKITVCSRSADRLAELRGVACVETLAGGFEELRRRPEVDELGIIATPTASLVAAAQHLASLGFRRLSIEKPVSLWSREIEGLAEMLERDGVEAVCGFNRIAYPSFHEVRARA